MNRAERRAHAKRMKVYPTSLTKVPENEWPVAVTEHPRTNVWRSRFFLVQEFLHHNDVIRLSINRTEIDARGRWRDDITWDELQRIKSELGYDDRQAIEVFPPDIEVVNVANMRHLWILSDPVDVSLIIGK